jgi:hypothetical protein
MMYSTLSFRASGAITVPSILANAGPTAVKRFAEFFTVPIRNPNTRQAYYRAINQFLAWCDQAGFQALETSGRSLWRLTSSNTQARLRPRNSIWPPSGCCSAI